jgi:predicted Zn-dependent protease
MSWAGHYLDGRSAGRRAARVRVTATVLEIVTDDGVTRRWPLAEVRQTQGSYPGEPVRLERGGALPETLIVEDVAVLAAVRSARGARRSRFHDPRRRAFRLPLTLGAAAAAVGLTGAFYAWGIPATASLATRLVPVAWEVRLGDAVYARLVRPEDRCQDAERQRAVDAVLARLTEHSETGTYHLQVTIVDRPDVNAFALPGGHIIVLRGLLERTDTPEMLAGVLAHEAQHVLRRHTTRTIIQHASTGLLVAAIAGDVTGLVAFALEGARVVGTLNYTRRAEEEADAQGLRMLLEAGIDPSGMVAFYDRVLADVDGNDRGGVARYLSTHPASRERADALRREAAARVTRTRRLLPDYDWKEVKRICTAGG